MVLPSPVVPDIRCAMRPIGLSRPPLLGFAAIAQLVEHVIRNDGVGGSSPSCGTIYLIEMIKDIVSDLLAIVMGFSKGTTA